MTDIKRELLIFLYEQRQSMKYVSINHIFKDCELSNLQIKNLLNDLKKNGIINIVGDYMFIGMKPAPHGGEKITLTTDDIPITATLTHVKGEQFVREHYIKSDQPTINAGQLVYAHGDINGTVNQSDNHSFSENLEITKPINIPINTDIKTRKNTLSVIVNAIWNNIILVIISALIASYIIYRMGWNGQYINRNESIKDTISTNNKK